MNNSEIKSTEEILKNIILQPVETLELEEQILPKIEELTYSNKSYKLKCSILFIDIRESTQMSKDISDKSMLKIYKSFIRVATQCVRYSGGVTRQFLGDRIMGVFLDEIDENGNIVKKSANKAIEAAREMNTYINYILNKLISKNINGKYIKYGIGVCTGKVLLAQVGMKGTEQDETKQNEKGDIWVGYITNQASKFADLTKSREIFIDENTYKELSEENKHYNKKQIWHIEKRLKGNKLYLGYVCKDLYVNNIEELDVNKFEYEEDIEKKNELIEELENRVSEYSIKKQELEKLKDSLEKERIIIEKSKKSLEEDKKKEKYNLLKQLLSQAYLNDVVTGMKDYWHNRIDDIFNVGYEINYTKRQIEEDICLYLASIYFYMELYDEAYDYIILHTRISNWYCEYLAEQIVKKIKLKQRLLDILEIKYNEVESKKEKLKYQEGIAKLKNIVL